MRGSGQLAAWSATVDFLSDEAPPAPRAPDPRRGRWTGAGRSLGDLYAAAAFLQDEEPSGECSSCGTGPKAARGGAFGAESAWSVGGGADPHARLATPNNPSPAGEGGGSAEDWISNEDEAQNDAVNDALEALAQGKYEGDIDEFWEDLESIEEDWEEASWREPDPVEQIFDHELLGPDTCDPPGPPITVPDEAYWDCPPEMSVESLRELCGELPCKPCPSPPTAADRAEAREHVYVDHTWTTWFSDSDLSDRETRLIESAWAVLLDNLDVVEWAACLTQPNSGADLGACLRDHIRNGTQGVIVRVSEFDVCELAGALFCTWSWRWEPVIHIHRGDEWDSYVYAWDENKLCASVELAADLLHELWHACNVSQFLIDFGTGEDCDAPIVLANIFRYVTFTRCPDLWDDALGAPSCCRSAADDIDFAGPKSSFASPMRASVWPCSP